MKKLYEQWPFNFGAIHEQDFKKAKILIAQIIYDATSSYMAGQREGPLSIIQASRFLDELLDSTGKLVGLKPTDIFTLDECVVSRNSVIEAMKGIEQFTTEEIIKKNKIPMVLGGEHSITYGVVKALKKKYKDLSVLQFDAHTDLIDEYEGSKFSHACVMRRILDLGAPAVQIGIRNMNKEIEDYLLQNKKQAKNIYFAPQIPAPAKILSGLTKNIYLTFDLDALDPSIMPSVGTAEPGGLFWHETIAAIEAISKKVNIVGADVMELCPIPGLEAPNFLAAKLVYKIILSILS
ncbi:MAG: agmatinase [Candidatus Portnoybacteria bacterium RIFCSPLOWO2_12_FULL_39_9]|uniref:Agmatinase n=1 Tax=Candidatus Portnoybacteria bacterium RIFCSPHIGHO2_12_FULL_38_9 TaxID=1801997 RepID=A0A1G2FHT4_9BACT|nr:MAG: agmatinase [Candidatus Portnoybacteria bacterium RIFCSPHIGHO2_02_FULL_39_12]OGZ37138.1 MAG: agmatinase [Candidatus Portnoybacteria bacterium RIFCSPHIGHO2_12_FULL_38_9]OGZ39737.1 MAG: agmatinase [Candidatus Portnoybacteria bacterium RIFCSPLOWO2_12_FULL_39_9]